METKSIFQSKTVWFNIAIALIGGIAGISAPDIADLGLSAVASAWILKACGLIGFIGNVYLRTITSTPITAANK
ncbi:hypothetical protein UFOVP1605_31 [uncultured Caudovirales phage]|uniref:Holin n=1 Tax=uncultured Caudovirales phage TaxID=2100421 RepID=A0A6J5SV98_9CAUD|nr:hypothetical protein UFOVP1605_31 [uncultured Caudovirales phage]